MEIDDISQNSGENNNIKSPAFVAELKKESEPVKDLCRCCLSVDRPTKDVMSFRAYFRALAGINMSPSDGLPQRICIECCALLLKSVRFKLKMTRANAMLLQYLGRCAPFPMDPPDPELMEYASPNLNQTEVLIINDYVTEKKSNPRNTKVLVHNKTGVTSKLDAVNVSLSSAIDINTNKIKQEIDLDDYEDNITLEEYRTARMSLEDASIGSITQDDLDQILHQRDNYASDRDSNITAKSKEGKRKKHHKEKEKKKIKRIKNETEEDSNPKEKSSIRKQIDLDPNKIIEITLNPEEQFKQREEESKTNMKYPFKCHLCYKGFNFEVKLQNHMKKHSPSRGAYECTLCHMYLPTVYSHSVHSRIHNRRYQCVACGVTMIDRTSIVVHYQSKHEGVISSYKCDVCGKVSNNYKTHRGHVRNHHSGERPACHQCGKSFVNKDSLTEHIQIHAGVKNYECSVCNKRFRTRTQIKQHQLKHTDTKDYYCVECDVRFKSEHNLRMHLIKSSNHKDQNSFKFACDKCSKRFDSQSSLSHHVSVNHEGVRAHACSICNAALATKSSLHKHIARVHNGQRAAVRHQCDTCGKAFTGKSVLINHVRTHTGERPFECSTCGRKFAQRTAMLTHVKIVHLKLRRNDKIKPEMFVQPQPQPQPQPVFPKEETPIFDGYYFVPLNAPQP